MSTICIDSNLWYHARAIHRNPAFAELHRRAAEFLDGRLADGGIRIGITTYQIAEILELLRKAGTPAADRRGLFASFLADKFIRMPIDDAALRACVEASLQSGVHVYDYLVALPLTGIVDRIYSADDHFQHPHFTAIAPVENPVVPWRLREGARPMLG